MICRTVNYHGMTQRGDYMHESANITAYKLVPEGTYLQIFIPGKNLTEPIIEKHMNRCSVWLDDGRHISADQRRKIYATVNDISAYSGNVPEVEKEWLKYLHINRTGCGYFSLSDCSMDTARDVDTIGMGNDRRKVDDSDYRKICLCRKHHTEAHNIGMIDFESKYKVYGIKFEEN